MQPSSTHQTPLLDTNTVGMQNVSQQYATGTYNAGSFHNMSAPLEPAMQPPPSIPQSLYNTGELIRDTSNVLLNNAAQYAVDFPPLQR